MVHRLNRACRPCAKPSSISSFNHDLSDARTAEDKSPKRNGMNKSAKVVLLVLRVRIVSTPHTTGKPNCGPGSERITSLRKQTISSKQERRPGRLAARRCFACYPSGKGDP